jgi:chromosome segregation protein
MYLKSIEISGFKSFADKIELDLDNNISCVVGPNGSGKSNIVDAVRWVLGEQSIKSLRGDSQMIDVIFAGSKTRKPLNVAYVTLTFDNSDHYIPIDYDVVSIKRRLYRTGENEYFLNGTKCRLKDITELFMDTGVGKSSFNIISQGEISRILSNSPMERRAIIEEAAGIIKYKTRREEALRKLDRTLSNIDRVNDIINEIEGRVEPLREQSEQATKYLEIKKNLSEVEISLLVYEITNINNTYQQTKKEIDDLNKKILELNTKINSTEIEELKVKSLDYEKKINELNDNLLKLTREEEELNSQRQMLKERSKYDSDDIKVHDNINLLKEKELSINTDINLLNKDLELKENEFNNSKNKLQDLVNKLHDVKVNKDNNQREFNIKNKEYLENKNKISVIKDNLQNNGTLNNNVKRVLNNPRLTGILDTFGNILSIDTKYHRALEVNIINSKNFIITDDEESAKEAINFLKNNSLGRATFFPLSVIKPKGVDYEILDLIEDDKDYLGILSDFVIYDEKYRNIVLNLLGNILVVTDLDAGNKLSKMINNRYRIVTLDGDIVNVGGSITGGSTRDSISPISLKNDLADLVSKDNILEVVINDITSNITKLEKDIITIEEDIYKERINNVSLEENVNNIKASIERKKERLKEILDELSNLDSLKENNISSEQDKLNNLYYQKHEEKELLNKELDNYKDLDEKLKQRILSLEADYKLQNSELRELEKELKNKELDVSKMDFKLDNDLNVLSTEYEITYEKANEEYSLDMEPKEARTLVNKYKNELKALGMVNLLSIDEYKEVNTRYEFLTNQRNDLLNAKETLYSIIEEMDNVMQEEFKKTFSELQVEFQKVFRELFKGGDASLKLTNPDNILETGVDIYASPPGKSLKTITLLSGGEKTLTAISLLFAILNIRTVPFCIFDEVEAALDEANVDIFGHYLNNYRDVTQFLLITHKKRTMEYAKTLHGITMQESGVSKLVSVKLENQE